MVDVYPPEAFLFDPELRGVNLSPTGEHVAFLWNQTRRRELYVTRLDGEAPTQLTEGSLRGWVFPQEYCWHPAGDQLFYFHLHRDDPATAAINAITLQGDTRQVIDLKQPHRPGFPVKPLRVSPDGTWLLLRTNRLERYHLESGERQPVAEYSDPGTTVYSPNGSHLAFEARTYETTPPSRGLFVCEANGDHLREVIGKDSDDDLHLIDWRSDGDELIVRNATNHRYGKYAPESSTVNWFGDATEDDEPVGLVGDDGLVVLREDTVIRIRFDGETERFDHGEVAGATVGDDLVVVRSPNRRGSPPKLSVFRLDGGAQETLLQTTRRSARPPDQPREEELSYTTADGEDATVNITYAKNLPAPAVAFVYSPSPVPFRGYERWNEYFAHRGYTVVRPEVPNGTFSAAARADIAAVGDWLCNREWVDGDRIAVLGHSSGGRDVFMQLFTYPDRWRAGIARNGAIDLFTIDDVENGPWWLRNNLGDPEENRGDWEDHNPIDHVRDLEASLLIHHSEHDIGGQQGTMMEDALIDAGNTLNEEFEHFEMPNRGHNTADVRQVASELSCLVDFLDRRI